MRDTGLDVIGSVPWGTHFCQFYQDQQDLIDILVPYFAAGLRQNEFCMWVTSEPLGVEEARAALEAAVGDLEPYLRSGQLEILDYSEWYTRGGQFAADRVLQGWVDKLTAAQEKGFEGLRLTGNTFWLEQSDWRDFTEYEATVDRVIGNYRMLAICTYSLQRCGAPELLDVMANHAFALIKRGSEWQIVGRADRARSEESLLKEKTFSETAINSLPGVFYLFDESGTFLRWNRNFEEVTSYSSQEFAALHPLDLFEGEDRGRVAKAIRQVFASGKGDVEADLICKDGRRVPYYFVGFRMVTDGSAYLIGSGVDLTARKQVEEALRWQAGLLDVSYEAIFAWELDGSIISWNRGAEELYGHSREEAIGRISHELLKTVHPRGREVFLDELMRENVWTGEVVHTTKAGQTITVETRQQVVADAAGRRIVLETNRDITERKRAAEALEEQVRERTSELATTNQTLTREITERRRTEEELRATSIYARSLIEASLDPLVTISPEGRITDVNEATVEATGIPRTVLIGRDFSDYFTEPERAREGYQRVFAEGFVTDYPLTIRHRSGRLIEVLYNASVYRDLRGNVLGVFAAARDVTAQRQAAQYARSLIEASLDPLVTISPEGRITDVNEATVQATVVPRSELIGTDFSDYFTEPEQARAGYQRVFAEGFVTDYPLTIRHRDGRLMHVLYNASIYRDVQGNVLGVFAAARDVTAQRQATQYARSLIEASLDPLVTISPEGRITDVNEATVRVSGVPRERLIGTDFSNYFTEPEQARAGYRHVFSEGFVVDYPLTVRHRNGTLTDVLYTATVYRDVQGNVLGVFAAARDVTERKRAEEEVRRLNEELEERVEQRTAELTAANRELEAFTYSVSHDLRAPLRAMDGFSMALLEDYGDKLDGEAAEYLVRIRAGSQRMAQLIDDLLQLSRVTRGEMRRAPVNISALARTVAEELQGLQPARQVSLSIADHLTAEGDPRLLQLVLRNLLANAWKFTSKHATARIEVGLTERDGRPAFFVRDDGAGFDMTYVGKLFGVFQRLHGAEDFEGTGIGLATVQRIIHRHGGEVWAEGAPEQGATFYFTLPRMSSSERS